MERYQLMNKPGYAAYVRRTNRLIPGPVKRGGR
jgi:steroid 5-alpha reductase family enzyme